MVSLASFKLEFFGLYVFCSRFGSFRKLGYLI